MGLIDGILGGFGGGGSDKSGTTSTLAKALLLLLAAKAVGSHFGGSGQGGQLSSEPARADEPSGRIESGMLAGLPGLDTILGHFRGTGHADKVESWIGSGQNKPLQPEDVPAALGREAIEHLQKQTGLPRDQLLQQVATLLPQLVDKLTPDGRLPPAAEHSHC